MDMLPFAACGSQIDGKRGLDTREFGRAEVVILAQLRRAFWTVKNEHGLAPSANDMNVGGPMIVWVDHGPQSTKAKYRRHE
jgi:hypothetical protein